MKLHLSILIAAGLMAGCTQEKTDPAGAPKGSQDVKSGTTTKPSNAAGDAKPKTDSKPTSKPSKKVGAAPRLDEKVYDHFGEGVAPGADSVTVAAVAKDAKKFDKKTIRLTGKIQSVCKKKGCWMMLAEGPNKIRVKFKDYGFFMPLDSEGREAILDGKFEVKETSVAELKHLLEDAGRTEDAKKVTEPRRELFVMASGVALKKR